jgi:hypothetical protein
VAGRGLAGQGAQWQGLGHCSAWLVRARCSRALQGMDTPGSSGGREKISRYGRVCPGAAWLGQAQYGRVRLGGAGPCEARQGMDTPGSFGGREKMLRSARAWCGRERHGLAGLGHSRFLRGPGEDFTVGSGTGWHGWAWRCGPCTGEVWPGAERQGLDTPGSFGGREKISRCGRVRRGKVCSGAECSGVDGLG